MTSDQDRVVAVDQSGVDLIAQHADSRFRPVTGRGIKPLEFGRDRFTTDNRAERKVLCRSDGILLARVKVRRFVLQEVAEIFGLRDSRHGLLLGGEFFDGSDHRR